MCFVVPLQIKKAKSKKQNTWEMEDGRVVRSIVDGVREGDYLVCQQDVGVDKLDSKQALAMRRAIKGVNDELQKRS